MKEHNEAELIRLLDCMNESLARLVEILQHLEQMAWDETHGAD